MRQATIEKINQVNQLIEKGIGVMQACKKTKLSYVTYNKFNAKAKNPKKDLFMVPIQSTDSGLLQKLTAENAALRKFIKDFL
jgi:hypothetical protein